MPELARDSEYGYGHVMSSLRRGKKSNAQLITRVQKPYTLKALNPSSKAPNP